MNRPEQHITDTLGQAQLRAALEPLGWTFAQAVDYGIDFDIEVFVEGRTTGLTFKVQLKSSRASVYSAAGDFVSEVLQVKNAKYLVHEMQTPTVLVHADVQHRRTFWMAPQLDVDTAERIKVLDDTSSVTFRIPSANALPVSVDALLVAVSRAKIVLAVRAITNTPPVDFVVALRKQPDLDVTIRELKQKTDALRTQHAFELMLAGRLDEAEAHLLRVSHDPEAAVEARFAAFLTLELVEIRQAIRDRKSDQFRLERTLVAADRLRSLTRSGPLHLRLYAVALRKLAQLDLLLHESWGLFLNMEITAKRGGDPIWAAQLVFRWANMTLRISQKLQECFGFLSYALNTPEGWALGDLVLRLGKTLFLFAGQMRIQGQPEGEKNLNDKAFQLLRLAAEMAKRVGDEQRLADAAGVARLLSGDKESETYRWMQEQLSQIRDPDIRKAADDYVDRLERRERGEKFADTDIETTEKQIYENMAIGAGINLADPDDPMAEFVRIGIQDLDPTRVLRNCEHTFITLQPNPILIETLKLPTAGLKVLHCTKHGYAVRATTLDDADKAFRERFCSKCPDVASRPHDWTYSTEWQQGENKKHAAFAAAFWGRHSKRSD